LELAPLHYIYLLALALGCTKNWAKVALSQVNAYIGDGSISRRSIGPKVHWPENI